MKQVESTVIPSSENNNVFVAIYDNMRKGLPKHNILTDLGARYIDDAMIPGKRILDIGDFVTITTAIHNPGIVAELYEIPEESLLKLDKIKQTPEVFRRELIEGTCNIYMYTMSIHDAHHRKTKPIVWIQENDYVKYIDKIYHEQVKQGLEEGE